MVPATRQSWRRVNDLVCGQAERSGLTADPLSRLRLGTEEIFVNIVEHGYPPGAAAPEVVVEVGETDDAVWVRLIDRAASFDPCAAAAPAGLTSPLSRRRAGGLGIVLARGVLNTLCHEYRDGTNRTLLAVRKEPGGTVRDDYDLLR